MHELGIAEEVLAAIQKEAACHPHARVVRAGMRIGELAGVDISALQFAFDAMLPGTSCEGMRVEMESIPRKHKCTDCDCEFVVRHYELSCPHCQSFETTCIGGEELDLAFVEVEEYATN